MKRRLSAREYAVKTCSLSGQTKLTLKRKLMKKGYRSDEISAAVDAMEENGYINEKEYAKAFVSDSYRIKKHGARRIINELLCRGVNKTVAQRAVEEYGANEYEIICDIFEKRFGEDDDKAKVMRFFLSRGFKADDVRRCMDA